MKISLCVKRAFLYHCFTNFFLIFTFYAIEGIRFVL